MLKKKQNKQIQRTLKLCSVEHGVPKVNTYGFFKK